MGMEVSMKVTVGHAYVISSFKEELEKTIFAHIHRDNIKKVVDVIGIIWIYEVLDRIVQADISYSNYKYIIKHAICCNGATEYRHTIQEEICKLFATQQLNLSSRYFFVPIDSSPKGLYLNAVILERVELQ